MIHEVILSLIGQTGDIIILTDKTKKNNSNETNINIDQYCFEVNNNIHIFLNSEVNLINEIVEAGYYFYIINTFCLLVKKNTIYKNLTHIHKFNKLNEEKNDSRGRDDNDEDRLSSGSSYYSSLGSSDYSSESDSFFNSEEKGERKEEGLEENKKNHMETRKEKSNGMNYDLPKKEKARAKRKEVDGYFGVVLNNVKSMNGVKPYGYYANGIYNEIQKFVKRYLKTISEIEEYINNNNNTPLTQIVAMLEKKREEIIIIVDIIKNYLEFQKKEEKNIMEGEGRNKTKDLVDYLYENCVSGNSRIKNVYYKYFKGVGKIMLHQISSWILYGQLIDPYYEFFVQKRQFIYTDDRKTFLSPEELYENLFLTNVQSLNFEWNYLFFQSLSNMPECCIDKETGRKILFIGKSVRILIRSNRWTTQDVISLFPVIKILSKAFLKKEKESRQCRMSRRRRKLMTPYDSVFANENKRETNAGYDSGSSNIISSSSYSEESTDLENEETLNLYCKEVFDITVEKIRRIVAYKLWKYIVRDVNLIKIFDLYKDIYLLNSGDFYEYFFEKSWSLMHIPPNTKNEILLKIYAWKNASIQVEDYFRLNYENKRKEKLKLNLYDETFLDENIQTTGSTWGEGDFQFFHENKNNEFNADTSENIIAKYFYPRVSHKKFCYDSFETGKLENLIVGGMAYFEENKILLNNFYTGIKSLHKKKYYEYDSIFSVCINNYRQQILKGFKHGFDFALNFNNFFDNRSTSKNGAEAHDNFSKPEDGFVVGACFALVMQSVKNPLLFKTEVLESELGYWGNLGDCLSVEIKVKFFEKGKKEKDAATVDNVLETQLLNQQNENDHKYNQSNSSSLGDVEVEVSLYIGGKGISSFVHSNNSCSSEYASESILYRKLLKDRRYNTEYCEDTEGPGFANKTIGVPNTKAQNKKSTYSADYENSRSYSKNSRTPVLKIQSNKQLFSNIDRNSITKFRVRINCLKHSFSVYLQKLDEYNIIANQRGKNKIKPIIFIRALDMTQAFSLDIGNAYIGFYTCPILFTHKLLKQKNKLEEWFQKFYDETLQPDSNIYKKDFFNIESEKDKQLIQKELENMSKIMLHGNNGSEMNFDKQKNKKREKRENLLMFSCYDCCVEIYRWFHQSYKSPIEMPEVKADNEILIFYDKQVKKNVRIYSGLNNWNNIEIHFKLTWPIALIINTNTIYTYNAIFQFRFLLGRIYYNLKILCYHNRQLIKYLNNRKGTLLLSHLFSIRYKMQFFFFQLIRYLQEDIINYEYKLMTKQIHKSKDFEYTKSVHDLYISQVATKCFLRVHDLTTPLIEMIDVCFKFCYFFQCLIENELFVDLLSNEQNDNTCLNNANATGGYEDNDEDLKQVVEKLLQYNEIFDEKYTLVLNEMTSISLNTNQAHLVHLLTVLDYNGYASNIKETVRRKKEQQEQTKVEENIIQNKNIKTNERGFTDNKTNEDKMYDTEFAAGNESTPQKTPYNYSPKLGETNSLHMYKKGPYERRNPPVYSNNGIDDANFSISNAGVPNSGSRFDISSDPLRKGAINNFGNLITNNRTNNDYISNSSIFPQENESIYGFSSTMMQRNLNDISLNNVPAPIFDYAGNTNWRVGMESDNIGKSNFRKDTDLRKTKERLIGNDMIENRMHNVLKSDYADRNYINDSYTNMLNTYNNSSARNPSEHALNGIDNTHNRNIISNYRSNIVDSNISSLSDLDLSSLSNINFTADSNLLGKGNLISPHFSPNVLNSAKGITSNYLKHQYELHGTHKVNNDSNLFSRRDLTANNIMAENEITKNRNASTIQSTVGNTQHDKYNFLNKNDMNSKISSESPSSLNLQIKNNFNFPDLLKNYNNQYENNKNAFNKGGQSRNE